MIFCRLKLKQDQQGYVSTTCHSVSPAFAHGGSLQNSSDGHAQLSERKMCAAKKHYTKTRQVFSSPLAKDLSLYFLSPFLKICLLLNFFSNNLFCRDDQLFTSKSGTVIRQCNLLLITFAKILQLFLIGARSSRKRCCYCGL